jgi:HTH DNA binding domain
LRRLTIEFPVTVVNRYGDRIRFNKIKWLEVLQFLELKNEIAMIVRVEFKDLKTRMEDVFRGQKGAIRNLELLQRESGGIRTYFLRIRAGAMKSIRLTTAFRNYLGGGYLSTPYEFRDDMVKVTFIGDARQVKHFREFMDETRAPYKIVSLEDAKVSWKDPLNRLTEKQKRILTTAYKLGYFDIPKKTSIEELARGAHLSPSTVNMELRRGERHIISQALSNA